jgi:bifunctional UDP-N-acetylglucosamine pyrophosphorylase/glucosamine-1-phosphate N-acetyltransferase
MLTARLPDPTGYGRVVRENGKVRIVEHKDATAEQRVVDEVNVGVYLCSVKLMKDTVMSLKADNAQGEYYLTDIVTKAASVNTVTVADVTEMRGINTQMELAEVDAILRDRLVRAHQERGVRFRDPKSVLMSTRLTCGNDVVIGAGVQFAGTVQLGDDVVVEGPSVLKDCTIGAGTRVESFCHIESAKVAESVKIGPYARLRPGADLASEVHIGNFVEVKNSTIAKGSKANHLAYLGDADVGPGVNVGAGTITCNYDGVAKHRTTIGAGVFVGSNSTLVAPLTLGEQSYVAAGSTLTKDVPADALAFGRARQDVRMGYAKALRERLAAAKAKAKKG